MGLGAYPASGQKWLGMLGMHGTYEANMAMHDCDVMLCVGARFDDRITGRVDAFSPGSKKIHIDIDPSSINKNIRVDVPIIGVAGDASVQMTMQEMSTAVQFELPIKIFILNNQYMGMVRQWQQLLHGNRLSHSYSEALPDFVKLADAFGCVGIQAIKPGDLDGAIQEMINVKRPVLFDCRVAALENCFPMIPSGKAHNEMLLPAEANDEATAAAFAGGKALV